MANPYSAYTSYNNNMGRSSMGSWADVNKWLVGVTEGLKSITTGINAGTNATVPPPATLPTLPAIATPNQLPSWVVPVGIAAGAVILLLVLNKKKR